jgi:hypothetical protein
MIPSMKNLPNIFPVFLRYAAVVLFFTTTGMQAQTAAKTQNTRQISTIANKAQKSADISFDVQKEVYNLLVIVTDEAGNTVFLDTRYHFKGAYRKTVDLKEGKGQSFSVQIKNDDEHFTGTLSMR